MEHEAIDEHWMTGTIAEFRSKMMYLQIIHPGPGRDCGFWQGSPKWPLVFYERSHSVDRTTWILRADRRCHAGESSSSIEKRKKPPKGATIEALRWVDGKTRVIIMHGRLPYTVAPVDPIPPEPYGEFRQVLIKGIGLKPIEMDAMGGRGRRPPGRPGLSHEELLYRLAKAQDAEEKKEESPDMQWQGIAQAIGWNKGAGKEGIALLRDARRRLKRLAPDDPMLNKIDEYRRMEVTKKT